MKRKYFVRAMSMFCIAAVLASGTACGKKESSSSNTATDKKEDPFTITVISQLFGAQPPKMDSEIVKKMNEYTNTKLEVDFVPSGNTYKDKINVLIASNQLPMVFIADAGMLKSTNIVNAANNGMFWEVDPTFSKYPNLKKFYSDATVVENTKIDGKLYGLPRPRPIARTGLVYRKDWFDALNLKVPTNINEFYEAAKALTQNDPDKNGKNDTIGYLYADISTGSYGWNGISNLVTALGGFNSWGIKDGKVTPDHMTDEYLETLKVFRKMYQEKLMNQDFPLATGNKRYEPFIKGQAGMFFATVSDISGSGSGSPRDLLKVVPTAKIAIAPAFSGPKGQKVNATSGHNGVMVINKSAAKTEADYNKIMTFFDKMTEQSMIDLFTYGVEGIHYKKENGTIQYTDKKKLDDESGDITQFLLRPAIIETPADDDIVKMVNKAQNDYAKFAVPNVVEPFISKTQTELGGQLDKLVQDNRIKFVMGEIDEAGFKKNEDDWFKRGGEKIINEYTELYNKLNKK